MSATESLLWPAAQGLNTFLFPAVFGVLLWCRQWTWFGLILALCLGAKGWTHLGALTGEGLTNRPEAIAQVVWATLDLAAMTGAMLRARAVWTGAILIACTHMLFTGTIPLAREIMGLDRGDHYAINGAPVPYWLGLTTTLLLAILPSSLGIPWALVRQSNTSAGLLAEAQAQYARFFGAGLVALMLLTNFYFAWALVGQGAFSSIPLVPAFASQSGPGPLSGVNAALALLFGVLMTLFWVVPRRFIAQAVVLAEASARNDDTRLEDLAHPLWRNLARMLDQRRSEAIASRRVADEARAQLSAFFDHVPVNMSLHGLDGRYILGTGQVAKSYGISEEELRSRDMRSLAGHWPKFAELAAATIKVANTGEAQRIIAPFKSGDSEDQAVDVVIFPIRSNDGEIIQIGSLGIDITERTRAEAALAEREAMLAGIFDHAPVAITVFSREQRMVAANRAATGAYGMTRVGQRSLPVERFRPFWPEFDRFVELGLSVFETGQPQQFDIAFNPPRGAPQEIKQAVYFPIFSRTGEVAQVGLFMTDVTEQVQAQQELDRSRATLQAFFENIPAMTFIITPDRRYLTTNSYAAEHYGFDFLSPENLIGKSDLTGTPEAWHPVIAAAHRQVMEEGKTHTAEPSFDLPDGSLHMLVSRFPIRNAEGEITHVGGLIFDRTAEKRAAEAVVSAQESLHQSEKLAALGQLLAGVAHELNNPLTVVVGRSAILEEKLRETPHGKAIADLREAADRCNRIVRTFLAMARQSAPRRAAVQVNDAIEAALDMTAYGLRSSGVELVRKLDANLPEVEADEDQLVQVFTNLLINARHALEEHRPEGGKVTIATRAKGGKLLVEIADNGAGIPAEIVGRIFDPFFTTKAVGDGTGMGLAMSKGMIEEHGGRLLYSDAKGGGAAFTVEIPIAAAQTGAATQAEVEQVEGKGRGRVLVVDDEPSIRGLLVEILEGIELDCSECGDGAAALELLGQQRFDLVFCDVRMPVMDGVRFRQHLAEARPEMLDRLVFISGDVLQRSNARRAEIAGHPFVEKPFNPAEVRRLALNLLGAEGDKS